MGFHRNHRKRDNEWGQQPPEKKQRDTFIVSDQSVRIAAFGSAVSITVFATILFVIKASFDISDSDLQTLAGITAGLCGFALAIPLFLKDFDITSTFWKQFYLISITYLVSAFFGVISFMQMPDTGAIGVTLYLFFFIAILISVNVSNIGALFRRQHRFRLKMSSNPVLNLIIAYCALFLSLIFSKGNFWIYATALFGIYGFYLTLTLMLSILVELFSKNKKAESNDMRIKRAIQRLAERYHGKALDEQTLLDLLKANEFSCEPEIISRTKIEELVAEMDSETESDEPQITLHGDYDAVIIPRWTEQFVEMLNDVNVVILISGYYPENDLKLRDKEVSAIYTILGQQTGLSKELLAENNGLTKFYFVKGQSDYSPILFMVPNCWQMRKNVRIKPSDDFCEYRILPLDQSDADKLYKIKREISIDWIKDGSELVINNR